MKIWALVPSKGFTKGKSRLDTVLGAEGRGALARSLLARVLGALADSGTVEGILVTTDDAEVAALARARGAEVCPDPEERRGLAAIVDAGLAELARRGAEAAVVCMGDLPRLDGDDVRALCEALADAELVIGPDRLEMGTNALGVRPPDLTPTCFGNEDSFHRHRALAEARGFATRVVRREGIALDLDTPDDLNALER